MLTNQEIKLVITHLLDTWSKVTQCMSQRPEKFIEAQINYWKDLQNIFHPMNQGYTPDKRFQHPDWDKNLILSFVKKNHFLVSHHVNRLIDETVENKKLKTRLNFFYQQLFNATCPTNFSFLNPEFFLKTITTNGNNIVSGLENFVRDIGNGGFNVQTVDPSYFRLGENIACTPGKVVYQNDLMQLIQYKATTEHVYQYPLLIVPPWINKYYILDLQEENSFVKWIVNQGITVFMISWVNPTAFHRDKQLSDYLLEGPVAALREIKKITRKKYVNTLGYCVGGTLLGCLLAYFAKKKEFSIRSATFLTTLLDFSDPGELGVFIDGEQIQLAERYMKSKGYFDGRIMSIIFSSLRSNDLIWNYVVNNYLKGEKLKPFDLLYWNNDSTHLPEKVHGFYLRNMYLNNLLAQKNKIQLADVRLDLKEINVPSYFLAAEDDHIVPWKSCFNSSRLLKGNVRFVLSGSGHVAGVVNPPHRQKYNYRISSQECATAETFLSHSKKVPGSWWSDWIMWQQRHSGRLLPIPKYYDCKKKLEDAPGSYVKIKIDNGWVY